MDNFSNDFVVANIVLLFENTENRQKWARLFPVVAERLYDGDPGALGLGEGLGAFVRL